jgi:type I restriction enzyme M protein
MNMILHDDGHSNVIGADALNRFELLYEINRGFASERFDIVLTNPPFGAQVALAERPYLADYELGYQMDAKGKETQRRNQKTEILFLERIYEFLKPDKGRAAIIIPDGILTNSSLQYVRDWLREHFQLNAVISLPQFAFSHYGAGEGIS